MEQELERLEGTVEDIIYLNEDNGYTVFEVSGGGVVTVVCGVVGELHAGESVVCRGRYENHATYGRQFHAQECETDMPKDLEAVYAFLASRSLPYIGARTADKIIDKFGAAALEVIANDPAQLTLIPGISADKADRIQQEFKRMFGMRELIAYLAQFEISPRRAMEVFRTFGPGAMQAIQQNPYLLCGEPLQLDFRHADSIAQYYQMAGDCAQRLEAALLRTLRHNAGNGHTCLPRAQLLETASNFIHQPPEKLAAALDSCIQTGKLEVRMFDGTPYIYLPDLLAAEQDIADRLAMLTRRGKQTARNLDKNIQILELAQGFAYAPLQKEAIRKAMTENCLVLTGGPGTGKTTTVNAILQLLENEAERVALCAPTGRAAKRLSELTGRKASTIHRLLEVDYTGGVVSFIHNDKNLLKCDVVILDEMSMVDVKLFQALIAALRYSCRIIMVGDADQLPSVGPGNILGEIIRSGLVPTVCLNEIFRQAAQSLIVENAHHIISGEPLKKGGKTDDFFFLEADGDAAQKLVCDLVTTRLPRSYQFDPVKDITGKLQITVEKEDHPELVETIDKLTPDSVITVTGKVMENDYVKMGGIEMIPETIEIESIADALPIVRKEIAATKKKKAVERSSIDQRIDYRWIDLRTDENQLMFKAQSCFVNAMRQFLLERSFIEIHTPKLIAAASESGSEVFKVDYFDRNAYLAQSPQFYKQMAMAAGFERIFETGPVFRAEKSYTNKHSTEFSGFDLEFSYITSYKDVMKMEEELLTAGLKAVKEQYGEQIKEMFGLEVVVPTTPFPVVKLADLYKGLEEEFGYTVDESEKGDLTTEAERLSYDWVKKHYGHEFLFITDYSAEKRAFYHMRDENGVPQGYDLIWRGVEITTGAQREHRYDVLKKQAEEKGLAEDVKFYLEFFQYGCPPHGGFGLGIDRLTMLLCGQSIKDAEFLFRGPNRLTP